MKTEKQVLNYLSKYNWDENELCKISGYVTAIGLPRGKFSSPNDAPLGNFKAFVAWYENEFKFEVGDWVEMNPEAKVAFEPFKITALAECVCSHNTERIYIGGSRGVTESELQLSTPPLSSEPIRPFFVCIIGEA